MRNMSFMLTYPQMRYGFLYNGARIFKPLTRRNTWKLLKPLERLMACRQCQGLKKGEHIERIRPIEIVSNISEPLMDIVQRPVRESGIPEVVLEGFPQWVGHEEKFVDMYCDHNGNQPEDIIQRIELKHIWQKPAAAKVTS